MNNNTSIFAIILKLFALLLLSCRVIAIAFSVVDDDANKQQQSVNNNDIIDSAAVDSLYCSKTTSIIGEISQRDFDLAEMQVSSNIQIHFGIGQTACFIVYFQPSYKIASPSSTTPDDDNNNNTSTARNNINNNQIDDVSLLHNRFNGSLLYAFTFISMEHQHAIKWRYRFTIPQMTSNCVCDCSGGDDHCNPQFRYQNCSSSNKALPEEEQLCFKTYHPNQAGIGCYISSENADLCCQVQLRPIDKYSQLHAIYIAQPLTVIKLQFRLYELENTDGKRSFGKNYRQKLIDEEEVTVATNQGQTINLNAHQIIITANGPEPTRSLREDVYLAFENDSSVVNTAISINNIDEWNLGKAGWFRLDETRSNQKRNRWIIRNGPIKIQEAYHVVATNCKAQQYEDTLDAEFCLTNYQSSMPNLGIRLEDYYPWIEKVYYHQEERYLTIAHRSSPYLHLDIHLNGTPRIIFGYHQSQLTNIQQAKIYLDKYSNRFLNVTFAKGTRGFLLGALYDSQSRQRIDAVLSTYIDFPNASAHPSILELPNNINSSRWVCFHPTTNAEQEKCKEADFNSEPLQWYVVPSFWTKQQGDCQDCNQLTLNNFLKYLNPRYWIDGISGISETTAMVVEIIFYAIIVIIVIVVCRKIVCPLLRWSLCECNNSRRDSRKTLV